MNEYNTRPIHSRNGPAENMSNRQIWNPWSNSRRPRPVLSPTQCFVLPFMILSFPSIFCSQHSLNLRGGSGLTWTPLPVLVLDWYQEWSIRSRIDVSVKIKQDPEGFPKPGPQSIDVMKCLHFRTSGALKLAASGSSSPR